MRPYPPSSALEARLLYRWIRTLLASAGVVLAAVAVLLMVAPPVAAARLTIEDGAGDMWSLDGTQDRYVPAPGVGYGDFIGTTFRHRERRVVIGSTFVDLRRTRFVFAGMMVDQNSRYFVGLVATRRNPQGAVRLVDAVGKRINCTLSRRVNYDTNRVQVSFPRACLGNPRYLQFRIDFSREKSGSEYVDNPHNDHPQSTWTRRVRRG
jgi:hypothetical protein